MFRKKNQNLADVALIHVNACKEELATYARTDIPNALYLIFPFLHIIFQITELPRQLFYCQELKILNLKDNELSDIPAAVSALTNLKSLNLARNCKCENVCMF